MNLIKKLFVYAVVFATVLTSVLPAGVNVASAAYAPVAGDLIKSNVSSAVYYYNGTERFAFPTPAVYFSWYSDFSTVKTITADELAAVPYNGKLATMRPGTKMVKIESDPKVYAVEPGGKLRWVESEAVATALYGSNWNKKIVDVSDAFWFWYDKANAVSNKLTATKHPTGSLVKYANSNDIYYIDGANKRKVTDAGFTANKFDMDYVLTISDSITYTDGTQITGAEDTLFPITSGTTTAPVSTGALTISLAGTTPAASSIISDATTYVGQSLVKFADFNFTASADGNVVVKTLKITKSGISSDTDLDNVYLYEGNTRVAEGGTISSGIITFNNANGLFTVSAGTTKTISVKGDLSYTASAGKTIALGIASASDVTTGGTVSGTYPMTGNTMTVARVEDLGYAEISGYTLPTDTDTPINPDQTQSEVWTFTMQSHNQALNIERLTLTEIGSIQVGDLTNFKLLAGGVQVATAQMASDYTVTFDMSSSPINIEKGGSKQFSVRADIVKGSTKTFYFSFQYPSDVVAKDTNYNVYALATRGTTSSSYSWSVVKPTGNYKVSTGTVTVNRANSSPTSNISIGATNQTFAKFDFKASGEDVKIKNLDVYANSSLYGGLDNGKILVDGVQVGSQKDLTEETWVNFNLGSSFIVPAGTTKVVEIVADAKTTTSTNRAGTMQVSIKSDAGSNAQGMSSLQTLTVPSSQKDGNSITLSSSALTISSYSGYGSQTFTSGTNDGKLGSFVLTAGSASSVSVNSITVALSSDEAATVTNMYIKRHDTGEQFGSTVAQPNTSNVYSGTVSVPASGAVVFDLYASINSGADAGSWIANIDASGTANNGSTSVDADAANIQTITIGTGSLAASNGSNPNGEILIAGSSNNQMAEFTFNASNESYTVQELLLSIGSSMATSTAGVSLEYKDENNVTQTANGLFVLSGSDYVAQFTGLTMYVPKDSEATLKVKVSFVTVASGATSGASGAIVLDKDTSFKAVGSSGTVKQSCGTGNLTANTFYLRKSKPTFAKVALSATTPSSDAALFKFNVVADAAGTVDVKQLGFTITTSGVTVSSVKLYDDAGTALTDTGVNADGSGYVKLVVGATDDDVISLNTTTKTYEVRGTVTGWGQSGDEITTSFKQDTSPVSNSDADTLRSSSYNVWSDRSTASHTTATSDWTNGYLIKEMTGSQTFSKS